MIRSLNRSDLQRLNELNSRGQSVSPEETLRGQQVYERLFPELFLDHPNASPDFPSLVAEQKDGQLTGMLGVMNRRFRLGRQPIQAAVSGELYVEPNSRNSLCGIQLLKKFLDGPQDVSLADIANENTRQIWCRLGGVMLPSYTMTWMLPIDPCRFATSLGMKDGVLKSLLAPCVRLCDTLCKKLLHSSSASVSAAVIGEPLNRTSFIEHAADMLSNYEFAPEYDPATANWIWNRLNFISRDAGPSRQILVKDKNGWPIGWYIYQWCPGRVARVSQLACTKGYGSHVLAHLLMTLKQAGAPGAIGRLQPEFLEPLQDVGAVFTKRKCYVLVHTKNEQILNSFHNGSAMLSMLDGEGAVQLWNNPAEALAQLNDRDSRASA